MAVGDIIAGYAAIVSSIVAILQFRDHSASKEVLRVRESDEFTLADGYINLTITNLSEKELEIDFLGVGWGYRPWLWPWSFRVDEADGLNLFLLDGHEAVGWLKPLNPGKIVYAEAQGRRDLIKPTDRIGTQGFGFRACLLINHSMSNGDIVRPLRRIRTSIQPND